jgi:hypothetical protein
MRAIVVECPIPGTFLVRDPHVPIPLGKTTTDMSIIVQQYRFGFVCHSCGPYTGNTSREDCEHIRAAKEKEHSE